MTPFVAALIIPTGIGATIGGFGGDATPELNLLAGVCDTLITHPNVANAAAFQRLPENALYVEGYALDRFFLGEWGLRPVRKNRVGVVFDRGIDPRMLTLHLNTLAAVQTVHSVDIAGYALTPEPVQVGCGFDASGASGGWLGNPDGILATGRILIDQGAEALALCVQMPEISDHAAEAVYKKGQGVDPVGGLEALISHWGVAALGVPCAHAPVFPEQTAQPEMAEILDPRVASEFIVSTFLPCVLTGLQRAPRYVIERESARAAGDIFLDHLDALVVPVDALGGLPVLAALRRGIPTFAVSENPTRMNVLPEDWGNPPGLFTAASYYEAAGMLAALRQGLPVPFPRDRIPAQVKV